MCVTSSSTALIVLWLARTTSNSGVFRYNPEALRGNPTYFLYLDNKVQCLRACYEENECGVVEYNETNGYCRLYRYGSISLTQGYTLFREQTDSSCMTEATTSELSFQKIPRQENAITMECNTIRDVAIIQPYERTQNTVSSHSNLIPLLNPWGPDSRRLYFGEIYNDNGYFFYNAYAFTDYCVSAQGECLGVQEIQEYVDEQDTFFYDEPRRENMTDSGLGRTFYIAGIEY